MAAMTIQQLAVTGIIPSYANAAAGDTFINDGAKTFFQAKNTSGGAITVTFNDTGSVSPLGALVTLDADVQVSIPATTGDKIIGPFPVSRFGTNVAVAYGSTPGASFVVAAFQIP